MTAASQTTNGYGILRTVLEQARAEAGCSLGELTALSAQVDPYRLDTPQVTAMENGLPGT
jgi:hypothetical protein